MNSFSNSIDKYKELQRAKEMSIDIYGLYNVLCTIFKDLGVLLEDDLTNKEKFAFIEGRPNKLYTGEELLVSLELGSRRYGTINSSNSTINNKPVIQIKPRSLGFCNNPITGQVEEFFADYYENEIFLSVYSAHYSEMIRIVKYLESMLKKHRGLIEQRVDALRIVQINPTNYFSNSADTHIQEKTIVLQVYTSEIFSKVYEEIQQIKNQNIQR